MNTRTGLAPRTLSVHLLNAYSEARNGSGYVSRRKVETREMQVEGRIVIRGLSFCLLFA